MNPMTGASGLLAIARETIAKVPLCMAITVAPNGEANARVVQPGPLREDWTVGFMTNRSCRKVIEMEQTRRLTLAYQLDAELACVSLIGRPTILDDIALKRAVWGPDSDRFHPGGPEDPNVVIVKLQVDRIEIYSAGRDVTPAPLGLNSAMLLRDGNTWRYSESFPSGAG